MALYSTQAKISPKKYLKAIVSQAERIWPDKILLAKNSKKFILLVEIKSRFKVGFNMGSIVYQNVNDREQIAHWSDDSYSDADGKVKKNKST